MTTKVLVPPALVPVAVRQPDGQLLIAREWQRLLEQMAARINELEARVTALGG